MRKPGTSRAFVFNAKAEDLTPKSSLKSIILNTLHTLTGVERGAS